MRQHLMFWMVVAIGLSTAGVASADLETNGGFEIQEAVTGNTPTDFFPTTPGDWRGDDAEIVAAQNGISPASGSGMLSFIGDLVASTAFTGSEVFQIIDIGSVMSRIRSGGQIAVASTLFNRIAGDAQTDREFLVDLRAYSGSPADLPTLFGSSEIAQSWSSIKTDADPATWEAVRVELAVPARADFLVLRIAAVEDVFNDGTRPEFDGHYADGVEVSIADGRCDVDSDGNVGVTDGVNVLRAAAGLSSACGTTTTGTE